LKNRAVETYKKTVKTAFSFLKQTTRFDDLLARSIVLRTFSIVFCLAIFVAALTVGLLLTKSGGIFSPDSVNYMVAGENLHSGHGFGVSLYGVFKHNPGYPMMIAALMFICSPEQAARLIPVLSFALLMIPLFLLGKKIGGTITGCVACLMCLVLTPLLVITSVAWTDMPYICFAMWGILFLTYYDSNPKTMTLAIAALFIGFSVLVRIIGLSLVFTGFVVIVLANMKEVKVWSKKWEQEVGISARFNKLKILYQMLLFGILAVTPLFLYLCRCYVATGIFGEEGGLGIKPEGLSTILSWIASMGVLHLFTDANMPRYVILVILVIFAIFLLRQKKWEWLRGNYVVILCALSYLATLILNSITMLTFHQPNYLCPLYPPIILVTVSLVVWVCRQRPALFLLSAIPLLLFMVLQVNSSLSYYQNMDSMSVASAGVCVDQNNLNNLNSAYWHNEQGLTWLSDTDAMIYSNDMPAVWFILDRPAILLPRNNPVEIESFFKGWTPNSYIICFKEDNIWGRLTNDQIAELDAFWVVADYPTSTIWAAK
jgi:hypothetical protein